MKKLEADTEIRIMALRWFGLSYREIAILVGRSRSTVAATLAARRGEFVDPGPPETQSVPEYTPSEEEIWGTPDPKTGQRRGGLVHKLQEGFVDGQGVRHPPWSNRERLRRAGVNPDKIEYTIPECQDPLLPGRAGLDLPAL